MSSLPQMPTLQEMLEAGVHFGHQTRRWNPKMKPYIFSARNGVYVIDLQQTQQALKLALLKTMQVRAHGQSVLFVGTKKSIAPAVSEQAERCGQFHVTHRWLGGMLTNYQTVRKSIKKMEDIERMEADGLFAEISKKEVSQLQQKRELLSNLFSGIRNMRTLPGFVFVADAHTEQIAIAEARRLRIPVAAIVDTNTDPGKVDFPIPANDDAIKSVTLIARAIADTVLASGGAHGSLPSAAAAPVAAASLPIPISSARESSSATPEVIA